MYNYVHDVSQLPDPLNQNFFDNVRTIFL